MKQLPNLMTLANLLCGCLAIIQLFDGNFQNAGILVVIAGVLDFFDGFVARMVHASSELGKQLDSLADMVTFGVVPGFVLYHLFSLTENQFNPDNSFWFVILRYYMFVVTLFSCLRLAKFNIDPRQASYFIGVPTPANTFLVVSIPFMLDHDTFRLTTVVLNPYFLVGFATISAYLLVANIPLISFKFKTFGWKENQPRYLLMLGVIAALLILKYAAFPVIIIFYLILSLIYPPDKISKA